MFAIYLIVAGLIILCTFYYAGQWEQPENGFSFFDGQDVIIKYGVAISVFWPIVVPILVTVSIPAMFFYLGERKRKKINAKKAEKK